MLSRANSVGYANDQSPCSHHESPTRNVGSLRRAKSISAVPLVKTALTRSDRLTSDNMHQQAQAAASRAYTNDLRRKESLTGQRPMQRGNSVRFEASPPSDPEYNRYAYFDDYRR